MEKDKMLEKLLNDQEEQEQDDKFVTNQIELAPESYKQAYHQKIRDEIGEDHLTTSERSLSQLFRYHPGRDYMRHDFG